MARKIFLPKGTNKSADALTQINDALSILEFLGIPVNSTPRRLERMAISFLAVAGLTPKKKWTETKSNADGHRLKSREIITYVNDHYGENISSGSYDDIRRQDLRLLVIAGIVINSSANPNAATNDPSRRYALNPEYADLIKKYGKPTWETDVTAFMSGRAKISDALKAHRDIKKIPIQVNGKKLEFSPGVHNEIQKAIIEEFLPRYGYGAEILYVGDTADKFKFLDKEALSKLNFFEISHEELPDVIAFSPKKNWLYLIEAVHSANPINVLRHLQLKKLTKKCKAGIVYITAFLDRKSSQKFIGEIAWETEVWIADNPDHLIHFNGGRFLGPYPDV